MGAPGSGADCSRPTAPSARDVLMSRGVNVHTLVARMAAGPSPIGVHLRANIAVRHEIGLELGHNLQVADQKRVLDILTAPPDVEPARIVVAQPSDDAQHRPT